VTACATPSGQLVSAIAEPQIASAYLPLGKRQILGLEKAAGAAVVILPGVAVTNAHNLNLIDRKSLIGTARQSDLAFFQVGEGAPAATAAVRVGEPVIAYGQDTDGGLRIAHGMVTEIAQLPGYADSPYFIFDGNAGPGFSGGPVIDGAGRLVGITFGYRDQGGKRRIYAYGMARVMAEFSALSGKLAAGGNS
jgi:S1-C subfamily serine protease